MTVSISGTTLTFNDATTQTTARTPSNTVTSVAAGSGITVSSTVGAVTISATGGGTVTSVATGNGLSGGTITGSGTIEVAAPGFNTVGSYAMAGLSNTSSLTAGSNYAAGNGGTQVKGLVLLFNAFSNNLSGTWKAMGGTYSTSPCLASGMGSVFVRVS